MGNKIWENVIVFILLGIVIILVVPIVQGIFVKSQVSGAKTSAEAAVKTAEVIYESYSLDREIVLPFTVEFKKGGKYDLYENITKIASDQVLDMNGKKPLSGTVIIDTDGATYAKNIGYSGILCNMDKDRIMVCARKK